MSEKAKVKATDPTKSLDLLEAQFNKEFIETKRATVHMSTRSWSLDGESLDTDDLLDEVAGVLNIPRSRAEQVLRRAMRSATRSAEEKLKAWVIEGDTKPINSQPMEEMLENLLDPETPAAIRKLHVGMMTHFCWLVKRHIMGEPVEYEFVPSFWSTQQGTGKTTNIGRFLDVLGDFARKMRVRELLDPWTQKLLRQTRGVLLEEFSGATGATLDAFKEFVTSDKLDGRNMRREDGFHAPKRLACVMTANTPPPHGIEDTSGARRFWPIKFHTTPMHRDPERRARCTNFDYSRVWECVHASAPAPYLAMPESMRAAIEAEQERLMRNKTWLERFVEECLTPCVGTRELIRDVREREQEFARKARKPGFKGTIVEWEQKLNEMGFKATHGNRTYVLQDWAIVPDDSPEPLPFASTVGRLKAPEESLVSQ